MRRRPRFRNPLVLFILAAAAFTARAQVAQPPPTDPQLLLMMNQPSIELVTNVEVTATFDPPVVRPGQKSVYRVTFNALDDSVQWPERIAAPAELELRLSARGQIFIPGAGKLVPKTGINHHVRASVPGSFTIPAFEIQVYGRPVTVPAARLDVTAGTTAEPRFPKLDVDIAETNVYVGQPVPLRVLMASSSNILETLQELKIRGDNLLTDQSASRQIVSSVIYNGRPVMAYRHESLVVPLTAGTLSVFAQAFTAGNRFSGPITIQGQVTLPGGTPQYVLIDSDPVALNVRPLPEAGKLPGFTGAIGEIMVDPPQLSTNRVRAGDSVDLVVTFRSERDLHRFVAPPPPMPANWQVLAPIPGGAPSRRVGAAIPPHFATFTYTMIPFSNGIRSTPPIPFSYFDPDTAAYVNRTIPAQPIEVLPGETVADVHPLIEAGAGATEEKKPELSGLAAAPGRVADSLVPLQQRKWFVLVQLLPLAALGGWWMFERRRRYLEQHPDIVQRRRARRALRREKRALRQAFQARDGLRFATAAVSAMRVACAPHYPAEPRALVCGDVLGVLNGTAQRDEEVVRRFFAVADASQFSGKPAEPDGLLALERDLELVLKELEAKL